MTTNPFATALGTSSSNNSGPKITITKHHLKKKKKMQNDVYLVFVPGKVLIPTTVLTNEGLSWISPPIYRSKPNIADLVEVVKKERHKEKQTITDAEHAIISKKSNLQPILKELKISTIKQLDAMSAWYSMYWSEKEQQIHLRLHQPERNKDITRLAFPYETPVEQLVSIVLEDVKKYSYVLTSR